MKTNKEHVAQDATPEEIFLHGWREMVLEAADEFSVYTNEETILEEYDAIVMDIVGGERMGLEPMGRVSIIDFYQQVRNLLALITNK